MRSEGVGEVARSVWLVILTVFVGVGLVQNGHRVDDIQVSRRQGAGVTCAVANAVILAGRETIRGQVGKPETQFERNLEKLGYPPKKVRDQQAIAAAEGYAQLIAKNVARAQRQGAADLVRRDGTLDCRRFLQITHDRA